MSCPCNTCRGLPTGGWQFDETRRRAAEARLWLRFGYTDAAKVAELRKMLARRRHKQDIEMLISDMREQFSADRSNAA